MEKQTWTSPELVAYDSLVEITGDSEKCGSNIDDSQPVEGDTALGFWRDASECDVVD